MLYFLQQDEQLLVQTPTRRYVLNGPGQHFIPAVVNRVQRRKALTLGPTDYVRIENTLSGELHTVKGPTLYFLEASEQVTEELQAITLRKGQYVRIQDSVTGTIRVEVGEASVYLQPTETVILGPAEGAVVDDEHYFLIRSISTGQLSLVTEPQVFIPSPDEEVIQRRKRIVLKRGQYVRLIDRKTGVQRVEQGEATVLCQPNEEQLDDVQNGINLDENTAVLIRTISTGQLSLINDKRVYIPTADEEIISPQQRIKLEDHETVIIRDRDGRYIFRHGLEDDRSFFLEPYNELVKFWWASGIYKDKRELKLTKLDRRPKFMWYDFEVRTADNVELMLGITFFWQIVDVEKMVATTDDTTGDVCAHSRSMIIQAVSRTTLEDFLDGFNDIVHDAVIATQDPFYDERGVTLHAVEVRSITCKDPGTQAILNEIIQETTDRLNRLQKQESENEVRLRRISGEIEAEEQRERLLQLQRQAQRIEALADGESEAERVRAFFDGLGEMPTTDKIAIYNTLRKNDALTAVSAGRAQLYFTPSDVNLSIETKE